MRRFLMITSTVAAVVAVTSPAPAADNAPSSYLETLANCRRILVAGIDAPHCAKLVAARDAEPRPYTGAVDLSLPVYSTDPKERLAQIRADAAERLVRLKAQSQEGIAAERNNTAERIASDRNKAAVRAALGAAVISAARRR
jgi:hypothetical protein